MSETVNIYKAKTNLSRLVDRAAQGEEIVIAEAGKAEFWRHYVIRARKGQQNRTLLW